MKRLFKELIKTLVELWLRRRGLNYILSILVAFWISLAASLNADEKISQFLGEIKATYPLESWKSWQYIGASICEIIFTEGSYIILGFTSVLIFTIVFLKYKEISKSDSISPKEFLDQIKDIQKDDTKFLPTPPPKTTGFVGREQDLQELDARLKAKNHILLVNGFRAVGKSSGISNEGCKNRRRDSRPKPSGFSHLVQ